VVETGGDRRFYFPRYVWTPAGGWWNHTPPGYKTSLAVSIVAITAIAYGVSSVSSDREVSASRRFAVLHGFDLESGRITECREFSV
jgi:hypothetical protein